MYPNKPDNYMIVGDVDLFDSYGMVLSDGYTMLPPEAKSYTIDIPGGNGSLDLTESLLGDTPYGNRKQSFAFYVINVNDVELLKHKIVNYLHGKRFTYQVSMDPGYYYNGRFKVTGFTHTMSAVGLIANIKIEIEGDTFRKRDLQVRRFNAIGGHIESCTSGRMRTNPTIEVPCDTVVAFEGKTLDLPKGTWKLNTVQFKEGSNELYVNTYPIHVFHWQSQNGTFTWGDFRQHRLYELYKISDDGAEVIKTWGMLADSRTTWASLSDDIWSSLTYNAESSDIDDVYITYEWGDL